MGANCGDHYETVPELTESLTASKLKVKLLKAQR